MALTLTITNAGRAALINADGSGTRAVRVARVGVSGSNVAASAAATTLPGEVKRIDTLSGDKVAADVIHLVVRDESMAVYTVRSLALYLDDGTLFALYGQPDPIVEKSAQALLLLAIDVTLQDVAAGQITFGNANFLLPPATTDRAGVVELATDAEAAGLVDAVRALTPKAAAAFFTAANVLARLLQVDGAGSGLDADLLDGREAAEFALLAGAAFTGAVRSPALTASGAEGVCAAHATPLWTFYNAARTVRFGYLQHSGANGDLSIVNDQGGLVKLVTGGSTKLLAGPSGVDAVTAMTVTGPAPIYQFYNADRSTRFGYLIHSGANGDLSVINDQGGLVKLVTGGSTKLLAGPSGVDAVTAMTVTGPAPIYQFYNADRSTRFGYLIHSGANGHLSIINDQGGNVVLRTGDADIVTVGSAGASIAGTLSISAALTRNGAIVWDAGNDGAGSGLDADLLDGRQAADFALLAGADFTGGLSAPGVRFAAAAPLVGFYNAAQTVRFGYIRHAGIDGLLTIANEQGTPIALNAGGSNVLVVGASGAYVTGLLQKEGAGRYLHHAEAGVAGDTITRSASPPAGGANGDVHFECNTDAGTMRVWHNYAGNWLRTA